MGRAYRGEFWKGKGTMLYVSDTQAPPTGKEKSLSEPGEAEVVVG